MLTFIFITPNSRERVEYPWHVGENKPFFENPVIKCAEVIADGDELDFIVTHFRNLPVREGRTVRWRGEFAAFIHDNL